MEIKRKGISPSTWKSDVECPHCHAILTVSVKDISIRTKPKRNAWGTKKFVTLFQIKCKECKSTINLKEEKLPGRIIDYLYNHRDSNHFLVDFFECYFS